MAELFVKGLAKKVLLADNLSVLYSSICDSNPKPHDPDLNDVIRMCDTYNIPLATNLATAEIIILAIDRGDLDWREMYR